MWTRISPRAWSTWIVVALLAGAAVSGSGCRTLLRAQAVKISAWNNPRFAAVAPVPAQVQIGPVLDCSGRRTDIAPADKTRAWLADEFFPAVWRQLGAANAPAVERPAEGSGLCEHLYNDWYDGTNYQKEDGGPKLAAIARGLLDGSPADHVFVVAFARRSYCYPVKRDIRDANGVVIGSVDTGEETCEENGQIDLAGYLLSVDGALLYMSSGRIEHQAWFEPDDTTRAAEKFVGTYPRAAPATVAARR